VGVSSCGGNVEGGGRERTTWPVLPARTAVVIVVDLLCRRCGVWSIACLLCCVGYSWSCESVSAAR
jgi:hypothetical protein